MRKRRAAPAIAFARESRISPPRCGKRKFRWLASAFGNSEFGRMHGKKRQNSETRQKHAQFHFIVGRKKFWKRLTANRIRMLDERLLFVVAVISFFHSQAVSRIRLGIGEKSSCLGVLCRLANFWFWRVFGGSKSGIRWLSIGLAAVLLMKKEFPRTSSSQSIFSGNGF